jgi:hypothetical protein
VKHIRMIHRLSAIASATLMIVAATLVLTSAGCGASARTKVLQTTLTVTNAARDAYVSWDAAHQREIVDAAKTLDESKAKLAEYRATQAKVVTLFEGVYRAIAVATLLKDDPTSLANLAAASGLLMVELHSLTGGKI